MLHACAEQGDFTQAERIIKQMREARFLPGPRAHHALIFSYVKGKNPEGALDAIRNEKNKEGMMSWKRRWRYLIIAPWTAAAFITHTHTQMCDTDPAVAAFFAGIQPLPQSYTAVIHGFLQKGNIEKAEAVYASNRRAGVPFEKSWAAICTALFNAGEHERGVALLQQASY